MTKVKKQKKKLSFSSVILSPITRLCIITAIINSWFCHIPPKKKRKFFFFCEKEVLGLIVNKDWFSPFQIYNGHAEK